MNAYDIANDLDREGKFPGHVCYGTSPLLVRAANMLRQQAALLEQASRFIREQGLEGQWIIWADKEKSSIEGKGRIG